MKYRKKVAVEAIQWFKNGDHPEDNVWRPFDHGKIPTEPREGVIVRYFRRPSVDGDYQCPLCGHKMNNHGFIDTLEGGHTVCVGDWIITGVKGEHHACKPDIFALSYEPAQAEETKEL